MLFDRFKRAAEVPAFDNVIAEGSKVRGDVEGDGSFQINGTLDGSMITKGRVLIGEKGSLLGNLRGASIIVLGHVEGDIECTGHLEIGPSGRVMGDIKMNSFSVASGGIFRGSSRMATQASERPEALELHESEPAPALSAPRTKTLPPSGLVVPPAAKASQG
jgi:cytoskeletal protein CcmA (bactofilin family)